MKMKEKYLVLHSNGIFLSTAQSDSNTIQTLTASFLAHLSQRLIGELIVYSCSGVRPSYVVVVVRRRPQFQTSSPKPLARSKPNFMWSLLG